MGEGYRRAARPSTNDGNMSTTALDSRGTEMAIVSIVVTVISVVAVALRCYTMSAILKRFLIEDWLAVITCVSTWF